MTTPDTPRLCRAQYERPEGRQRGDRIVECGRLDGRAGDHDEMIDGYTGIATWPRREEPPATSTCGHTTASVFGDGHLVCELPARHHEHRQGQTLWVAADPAALEAKVERLKAELAAERRDVVKLIGERDRAEKAADRLAYAIAPVEAIGEHSNDNDPWANAVDNLEATLARLTRERDEARQGRSEALARLGDMTKFRNGYRNECQELERERDQRRDKARKRKEQRDKARRMYRKEAKSHGRTYRDLSADLTSTEAERDAMRPVVEAARAWREIVPASAPGETFIPPRAVALVAAVDAYADNQTAEDGSQDDGQPRVWTQGDPEPGPDVTAVRDRVGDAWVRHDAVWRWRKDGPSVDAASWTWLLGAWGPLTEVTDATPNPTPAENHEDAMTAEEANATVRRLEASPDWPLIQATAEATYDTMDSGGMLWHLVSAEIAVRTLRPLIEAQALRSAVDEIEHCAQPDLCACGYWGNALRDRADAVAEGRRQAAEDCERYTGASRGWRLRFARIAREGLPPDTDPIQDVGEPAYFCAPDVRAPRENT